MGNMACFDSLPGIGHLQSRQIAFFVDTQRDTAAFWRVAQGVINQVIQHTPYSNTVNVKLRSPVGLQPEIKSLVLDKIGVFAGDLSHKTVNRKPFNPIGYSTSLHAGNFKEVLDQALQIQIFVISDSQILRAFPFA